MENTITVGSVYYLKKGDLSRLYIPTKITASENPEDGDHDDVLCLQINLQNQETKIVYRAFNFLLDNCEKLNARYTILFTF
jgi:hypothetical protein